MVSRAGCEPGERGADTLRAAAVGRIQDDGGIRAISEGGTALEAGCGGGTVGIDGGIQRGACGGDVCHSKPTNADLRSIDVAHSDVGRLPVIVACLIRDNGNKPGTGDGKLIAVQGCRTGDNVAGGQAAAGCGIERDGVTDGNIDRCAEGDRLRRAERGQDEVGHELIAPAQSGGTARVVAAAPQCVVGRGHEGVIPGLADGLPNRARADPSRAGELGGAAIAELAVIIQAPAPECAVRAGGEGVVIACGSALPVGPGTDLERTGARGGGAVAELAVAVAAPGPERAVGARGDGVILAAGNGAPVGGTADGHGSGARRGRGAVASLSVSIVAPSPESAALLAGEDVETAAHDAGPVRGGTDLHGNQLVGGAGDSIAHLAVEIVTPGPEGAVAAQADGEVISGADADPV